MFLRRGPARGDGTVPSGTQRVGSVGRGDVFVVDEDTDLLDPVFQGGGHFNPEWKPPRRGPKGSQEGKHESSSKHLEENITTDKEKTDAGGRGVGLFPGKPSGDIVIDLDTGTTPKKPSAGLPVPKISTDPEHPDSNKLREEVEEERHRTSSGTPYAPTSEPHVRTGTEERRSTTTQSSRGSLPDDERPGTVTIVSRDGDMVVGSDGSTYRLQRGPPGRMGPPGKEVRCPIPPCVLRVSISKC